MVYHVLVADRNPYKQSHRRTIKGDTMTNFECSNCGHKFIGNKYTVDCPNCMSDDIFTNDYNENVKIIRDVQATETTMGICVFLVLFMFALMFIVLLSGIGASGG